MNLSRLVYWVSWQQKMQSGVAHMKRSPGQDRRESHSSDRRSSAPEGRFAEQECAPRDRDYSDYSWTHYELLEQDALMMTVWLHEVGIEKNTEKEIEMHIIVNGPGNGPHLLKEAQTEK